MRTLKLLQDDGSSSSTVESTSSILSSSDRYSSSFRLSSDIEDNLSESSDLVRTKNKVHTSLQNDKRRGELRGKDRKGGSEYSDDSSYQTNKSNRRDGHLQRRSSTRNRATVRKLEYKESSSSSEWEISQESASNINAVSSRSFQRQSDRNLYGGSSHVPKNRRSQRYLKSSDTVSSDCSQAFGCNISTNNQSRRPKRYDRQYSDSDSSRRDENHPSSLNQAKTSMVDNKRKIQGTKSNESKPRKEKRVLGENCVNDSKEPGGRKKPLEIDDPKMPSSVIINDDDDDDVKSMPSMNESEGEDPDDIKIERIIACRRDTLHKWNDRCIKINTSEIEDGSRWFQERRGSHQSVEERFLIKWTGLSYLHCSWETEKDLFDQVHNAKTYLSNFSRSSTDGFLFDADERGDGEFFDPRYIQIERILEVVENECAGGDKRPRSQSALNKNRIVFEKSDPDYDFCVGKQLLVKWCALPYSSSTYEFERDLILNDVDYKTAMEEFMIRRIKPDKTIMLEDLKRNEAEMRALYKVFGDAIVKKEDKIKALTSELECHVFSNGGQLRDYQVEGISWLLANYVNKRGSILADEMGLGKTIQAAVFVHWLRNVMRVRGPFLVIAPLSTIPHWYREFTTWTNLNTIVYHGSAEDREYIRELEFAYECDRPPVLQGQQSFLKRCHKKTDPKWQKTWMVEVVLTTPEIVCANDFSELTNLQWELLIVDEAHRLKNHSSKLANSLRDNRFVYRQSLLLTGTPIQNNMNELWTLLNMVNPNLFADCNDFMSNYGDMKSKDKVDELHENIRPYILRRLKEDVEKSVPPKEETLIEVELTVLQKQYYRALYEKNVQFLHRNAKKALDGPSLNNIAMQLRKCCNHPFLLNGVEAETRSARHSRLTNNNSEADFLVKASGKLVLLDKLLPKLKEGGHRVLIFSQFKIMLDILEDYLRLRNFKAERIDGSITGRQRQMAIDRFQAMGSIDTSFIMLLTTRAGGVGINLTAADTCIIYDSDWNPQNDLQAQARCHRIGQTKSVKVYRLLTRKSYEMQMFHMSSLKMGLDQVVLQGLENGSGKCSITSKAEIEKLLRYGAYDVFCEEKGVGEKESSEFLDEDIDTILLRRTKTLIHDNNNNSRGVLGRSTFSKAVFKSNLKDKMNLAMGYQDEVDVDDPDFWRKILGDAFAEDHKVASVSRRSKRQINYDENAFYFEFEGNEDRSLELKSNDSSVKEEEIIESNGDDSTVKEEIVIDSADDDF